MSLYSEVENVPQQSDRSAYASHLQTPQRQKEVEKLDQEWELECKKYLMRRKYGRLFMPGRAGRMSTGVGAVVFGLMLLSIVGGINIHNYFSLFAALFIVVGIGSSFQGYKKALRYEAAEQRYYQRRAKLLRELQ